MINRVGPLLAKFNVTLLRGCRGETCAVVKANFNVYSVISDAQTLENSSNQCSAIFSQIYSVHFKISGLE